MKTLGEFLDRAKEITGSDYKTAQRLKMTRSGISHARKSGSMDSGNAVELAKILDINPVEVLAACDIAKKPENREFWGRWVAAGTAAAAILTALIFRESAEYSMAYMVFLVAHTIDYAQLCLMRSCGFPTATRSKPGFLRRNPPMQFCGDSHANGAHYRQGCP